MGEPVMPVTLDSIVQVSPDQVSCDLGGEAAMLNLNSGVYYGLDPIGARIWTLLSEPRTVASVRDVILEEYEVEPEVCERDLLAVLGRLSEEGLIEIKNETAA
jgi:hypothetical protein